jgi:hypothetical protein
MRLATLIVGVLTVTVAAGGTGSQRSDSRHLDALLLVGQIAVEEQTGRGGDFNESFSGVGSLRISLRDQRIYNASIFVVDKEYGVGILNEVFALANIRRAERSIEFEATDLDLPLTYRGKVWLDDNLDLRFEMVRSDSPRKWVNLGPHGRKFLHDRGLKLRLGI